MLPVVDCHNFRQVTLVMIGVTDVATGLAVSASTFQEFSVEAFGTYVAGQYHEVSTCIPILFFRKLYTKERKKQRTKKQYNIEKNVALVIF